VWCYLILVVLFLLGCIVFLLGSNEYLVVSYNSTVFVERTPEVAAEMTMSGHLPTHDRSYHVGPLCAWRSSVRE
jgi:hypothetical protein